MQKNRVQHLEQQQLHSDRPNLFHSARYQKPLFQDQSESESEESSTDRYIEKQQTGNIIISHNFSLNNNTYNNSYNLQTDSTTVTPVNNNNNSNIIVSNYLKQYQKSQSQSQLPNNNTSNKKMVGNSNQQNQKIEKQYYCINHTNKKAKYWKHESQNQQLIQFQKQQTNQLFTLCSKCAVEYAVKGEHISEIGSSEQQFSQIQPQQFLQQQQGSIEQLKNQLVGTYEYIQQQEQQQNHQQQQQQNVKKQIQQNILERCSFSSFVSDFQSQEDFGIGFMGSSNSSNQNNSNSKCDEIKKQKEEESDKLKAQKQEQLKQFLEKVKQIDEKSNQKNTKLAYFLETTKEHYSSQMEKLLLFFNQFEKLISEQKNALLHELNVLQCNHKREIEANIETISKNQKTIEQYQKEISENLESIINLMEKEPFEMILNSYLKKVEEITLFLNQETPNNLQKLHYYGEEFGQEMLKKQLKTLLPYVNQFPFQKQLADVEVVKQQQLYQNMSCQEKEKQLQEIIQVENWNALTDRGVSESQKIEEQQKLEQEGNISQKKELKKSTDNNINDNDNTCDLKRKSNDINFQKQKQLVQIQQNSPVMKICQTPNSKQQQQQIQLQYKKQIGKKLSQSKLENCEQQQQQKQETKKQDPTSSKFSNSKNTNCNMKSANTILSSKRLSLTSSPSISTMQGGLSNIFLKNKQQQQQQQPILQRNSSQKNIKQQYANTAMNYNFSKKKTMTELNNTNSSSINAISPKNGVFQINLDIMNPLSATSSIAGGGASANSGLLHQQLLHLQGRQNNHQVFETDYDKEEYKEIEEQKIQNGIQQQKQNKQCSEIEQNNSNQKSNCNINNSNKKKQNMQQRSLSQGTQQMKNIQKCFTPILPAKQLNTNNNTGNTLSYQNGLSYKSSAQQLQYYQQQQQPFLKQNNNLQDKENGGNICSKNSSSLKIGPSLSSIKNSLQQTPKEMHNSLQNSAKIMGLNNNGNSHHNNFFASQTLPFVGGFNSCSDANQNLQQQQQQNMNSNLASTNSQKFLTKDTPNGGGNNNNSSSIVGVQQKKYENSVYMNILKGMKRSPVLKDKIFF